jgi:Zn-dependent peptidase ImmA (M78 family)
MRRGFATEARTLALEVRGELGLTPYTSLDPWALAQLYGIPVYPLDEMAAWGSREVTADYFTRERPAFSAALVPVGSARVIVENSTQARTRRRASISHEMAHVLLEHPFLAGLQSLAGCRATDREVEQEADCLGGELLIPSQAALAAARDGATDEQVARRYRVSIQFARMRMNRSGARKRAAYERDRRLRRSA